MNHLRVHPRYRDVERLGRRGGHGHRLGRLAHLDGCCDVPPTRPRSPSWVKRFRAKGHASYASRRMADRPFRKVAVSVGLLGVGCLLAGCSSGTSPSTPPPNTGSTTKAMPAHSTTSSRVASGGTTTTATMQPQTPTSTEFISPSGNISCEIDYNFGQSSLTSALCLTLTPPKSVTLGTDGSLVECNGDQCLSNAGVGTPTLKYGDSIRLGPFICLSSMAGVKCALANGDGFSISRSGTTPLGNSSVTQKATP
jgi:hypothetical protein